MTDRFSQTTIISSKKKPVDDDDKTVSLAEGGATQLETRVVETGAVETGAVETGAVETQVVEERPKEPTQTTLSDETFGDITNQLPNPEDYTSDDIINNRFILENSLGSGGMGQVFKAKDLRRVEMQDSQPYVALKLLRMELQQDISFIQALQRESKKAQLLAHPNIITVYDFDRDKRVSYITMEYLEGESLDKQIQSGLVSTKQALYMIDRMARGLAYAHQEGFVHADFKPANIFVTEEEQIKILDFGIAQAVIRDKGQYRSDTRANAIDLTVNALTPNYASLEMLKGESPLPVDDVYSLCCVAYELLTGDHPYHDEKKRKVTAKQASILGMEPPSLKGVPRRYARAIRKGLALDREGRFDNAGDFLDATKPKITKTHIIFAAIISLISVLIYFGTDFWQETKVPELNSLTGTLVPVAEVIGEGDEMLKLGDIDFAHRLYAQAWDESTLQDLSPVATENLRKIIDDRMNRIAKSIIQQIDFSSEDVFMLQQYEVALESLRRDALGNYDKNIDKALGRLEERITELDE